MFQGTGSDVGKSLLVAGLCRAYKRRGLKVAPFKPQNMSNNAAVTADGGEIGRAQALQARACGLELTVDMNPVLLKPQTEVGAQVVVQGQVEGAMAAREYTDYKLSLLPRVLESYQRLSETADLVLIEGAGSAAEVNLRKNDIANMGFAEAANLPVVLIGDIDRGGVIASIVGTHELITEDEKARLVGYIINKFRGDASLFDDGLKIIGDKTGLKSFGVVPWFKEAGLLPAEDAMSLGQGQTNKDKATIKIAVPRLSRIANFDDLDPLAAEPDVEVVFLGPGDAVSGDTDVVLIPGTKATIGDLHYLRSQNWHTDILAHYRRGGMVVGLCGGYQMLGNIVRDPLGIEGPAGEAEGLGLLNVNTTMEPSKTLWEIDGTEIESGKAVKGYQIHMGETEGVDRGRPWFSYHGAVEGAISADGRVLGSYLHGMFASDEFRGAFLDRIRQGTTHGFSYEAQVEETLDNLANYLEEHLDLDQMLNIAKTF
ncbi:MAG: cobyric acid synthase [Rhodospirillales bacterium]|nr:cobyric acid synthase [Rhodospirillales bacterium]